MPLIPTARSVFPLARRWGAVCASTGWGSTTRLPPGRRTSYPHAESDEEEFIYVLEGYPEVWINGYLWKLEPGDSVGFPAGTGVCHTFLNNTGQEVRLLVVGEANKKYNRIYYPLNPGYAATRRDRWVDHPPQFFGPHDGKPRIK